MLIATVRDAHAWIASWVATIDLPIGSGHHSREWVARMLDETAAERDDLSSSHASSGQVTAARNQAAIARTMRAAARRTAASGAARRARSLRRVCRATPRRR